MSPDQLPQNTLPTPEGTGPYKVTPIFWPIKMEHGKLGLQAVDDKLFIHCTIHKWSLSLRKEFMAAMGKMVDYLKAHKIERVYSMVPRDEPLVNKWQEKWGFVPVKDSGAFRVYMKVL